MNINEEHGADLGYLRMALDYCYESASKSVLYQSQRYKEWFMANTDTLPIEDMA